MYELVQVSEKCYYINCPAKIGVYAPDKDNVYLVDSGIFAESDRIEREGKMVKVFRNGKFVEVPEKSLNQDKI